MRPISLLSSTLSGIRKLSGTRQNRILKIPSFIFHELSKRKKENKLILANQPSAFKQFICLGLAAKIKSSVTFNYSLKRISSAASLPVVRMGDLRYMFAQFLVNQDFSMEAISAILGHTKLSTTLNFCSMFPNEEPKIGTVIGDSLDPFLRTRIPGYKGAY